MMEAVPGILARIVQCKREELARASVTRAEWERRAAEKSSSRRDFRAALRARAPAVVAEIKKASPSKGLLVEDFDPPALARDYEQGGAAALSVLTDREFFQGSLLDLVAARAATRLPVLRKDFTLEELQIAEAAAHGADAILLIAAILPLERLRELREYAGQVRNGGARGGPRRARTGGGDGLRCGDHRREQPRPADLRGVSRNVAAAGFHDPGRRV